MRAVTGASRLPRRQRPRAMAACLAVIVIPDLASTGTSPLEARTPGPTVSPRSAQDWQRGSDGGAERRPGGHSVIPSPRTYGSMDSPDETPQKVLERMQVLGLPPQRGVPLPQSHSCAGTGCLFLPSSTGCLLPPLPTQPQGHGGLGGPPGLARPLSLPAPLLAGEKPPRWPAPAPPPLLLFYEVLNP